MDIAEGATSVCTDSDRVVWDTAHICADEEDEAQRLARVRLGRRTQFRFLT